MRATINGIAAILGDIRIAHSVFALPFALASAHVAFLSTGGYKAGTLAAILVCMVTARTAAMSFNRFLDRDIDALNPRTSGRSLPSGRAKPADALVVVTVCALAFIASCWYLGPWPLILSLPTLAFILAYSWTKRFTSLTHIWLGLALAIAPSGAWLAITGSLNILPVLLSAAVTCWVAGFDIIYSLQDIEFDIRHQLLSLPSRFGVAPALWVSRILHAASLAALAGFGMLAGLTRAYYLVLALTALVLFAEHLLVKPGDISRIGVAFFTMNGVVSILFYIGVLASATEI